jgi:hypothetical protein
MEAAFVHVSKREDSANQSHQQKTHPRVRFLYLKQVAEWTGLEPATPGVTGRYSNQLNYHS